MSDPIVFGFPRSTFVQIVRLVLTHKNVTYTFRNLEPEMGKPTHLALHPFNRGPLSPSDEARKCQEAGAALPARTPIEHAGE